MRNTIIAGLCVGVLAAVSLQLAHSATPSPGQVIQVRALRARIMGSPQFLGSKVATLKRGARVKVIQVKGSWYKVSYGSRQGWMHKNRVTIKKIKLSSGDTGGGTTQGEAELAGRGFNPKVEQEFRQKNPKLDYSHLDKIQQADVEIDSVTSFQSQGGVKPPTKGGGK